jgi:acetoin utilization protein AcuC
MTGSVCVYVGEALARYNFGASHPFGPGRLEAFWAETERRGLDRRVQARNPVVAEQATLERFHTHEYVERVKDQSRAGAGYLDYGDTPAFPGVYEAAACVVGCTEDALAHIQRGVCRRAFVPIGGLHHARRNGAAGFCVFNDCGVAIELLRDRYGVQRIAYVDIDAHHGDGVFYGFEEDPMVFIADIHEDGRYLYPGTGSASEAGCGLGKGTKLNVPLAPGADDARFREVWPSVEGFVRKAAPQFILFQCGADGLAADPLTHLGYSAAAHGHAARRLCAMAEEFCEGRLLAWGGGGYSLPNLASAWTTVLEAMVDAS